MHKFSSLSILGVIVLVLFVGNARQDSATKCPRYCFCFLDASTGLKSVSCIAKRLDNIDLSIPKRVEVLDLSNNSISYLEDRGFMNLGLTNLVQVDLKFNSIRTVGLHSFAGLTYLEAVDLSSNNLYKILPWTFHDNGNLKVISLSNNPLGHVTQFGPLMDVPSLEVLHLSGCHFAHFPDDAFSALPNLRKLDVSDNQIISFDIYSLQFLYSLEELDVSRNPWQCDVHLRNLQEFVVAKSGRLVGSSCDDLEKKPVMFEKMISVGEAYNGPDYEDSSSEEDSEEDEKEATCDCRCQENVEHKENTSKELLPPVWLLLVGFQLGVCAAVILGYVYIYCSNVRKKYYNLEQVRGATTAEDEACSQERVLPRPDTPPPAYEDLLFTLTNHHLEESEAEG